MYSHRWLYICLECGHEKFVTDGQKKKMQRKKSVLTCSKCPVDSPLELVGTNPIEVKKGIYDYDKLVDLAQKDGWTLALVDGEMWSEAYGKNLSLVSVINKNKMWLQRVTGVFPDSESSDDSIGAINVAQESDEVEAPDGSLLETQDYEEETETYEQQIAALTAQLDDESLPYEDWAKIKVQIAIKTWELDNTDGTLIYDVSFVDYITGLTVNIMDSLGLDPADEEKDEDSISTVVCINVLAGIESCIPSMIVELLSQIEFEDEEEIINLHKYLKEKFETK